MYVLLDGMNTPAYRGVHFFYFNGHIMTDFSELGILINNLFIFFDTYKSMYLILENDDKVNVKFDKNSLFHCLGLNRIWNQTKISKMDVLEKIVKSPNKIFNTKILKNRRLSKSDKNIIIKKWKSFNIFFTSILSNDNLVNNVIIYKNKLTKIQFLLVLNNAILIVESNYNNDNFYNCHIYSMRDLSWNKIDSMEKNKILRLIFIKIN